MVLHNSLALSAKRFSYHFFTKKYEMNYPYITISAFFKDISNLPLSEEK